MTPTEPATRRTADIDPWLLSLDCQCSAVGHYIQPRFAMSGIFPQACAGSKMMHSKADCGCRAVHCSRPEEGVFLADNHNGDVL